MFMRVVIFLALAFSSALPNRVSAADPFVGVWLSDNNQILQITTQDDSYLLKIANKNTGAITSLIGDKDGNRLKTSVPSIGSTLLLIDKKSGKLIFSGIGEFEPASAEFLSETKEAEYRRYAQNTVSVAQAARLGGYTKVWTNIDSVIDDLDKGVTATLGHFSIKAEADRGYKKYIRFDPTPPGNISYYSGK